VDRDFLAGVSAENPQLATTVTPSRRGSFRALRSIPFRRYFAGQVISASGTFLQQTAIGWLVLRLTGSASSLGLVLAVGGVPSLVLGPWGGVIADRMDLRKLLIVTQTVFGVTAGALWILALSGEANVPVIIIINVVGGFVSIVDGPARQAFVSQLVTPADLASAVSLNGVVMNTARVVGPAVAGVLIVTVGTTPCFAVNAVSYVAVVIALLTVHPLSTQHRATATKSGVRDALQYVRTRQQLWLPLVMMALVGLLAFNFTVTLPVLARTTFHGSGGTYGLMTTMLSLGSIVGSLSVGLLHHPSRKLLVATSLSFGVCMTLTGLAPNVTLACAALVITGATGFAFVTLASTALQLHSTSSYRGRVMALWVFVFIGTTPIGSVVSGWIAGSFGPRVTLFVGAGGCLVAAAIAMRVRAPVLKDPAHTDPSQ
jgi:MFS family permease